MSGFRGVDSENDLKPDLIARKPNEFKENTRRFFSESAPFILISSGAVTLVLPFTAELLLIIGYLIFQYANNNPSTKKDDVLPMCHLVALSKKRPLLYSRTRYKREKKISKAAWCIGTTLPDYRHQYLTDGQLRRHLWVAGSTGSGKTQFILALVFQALVLETGCLLVDAKGSNATFWHFYSIVRRFDRVEDLLLFNFLSSSLENRPEDLKGKDRVTNTLNFMELGSAEELRSLFGDLLQDTGAPIWKGKAKSLLYLVLLVGTELRDRGEITLSIKWLRNAITSANILNLATDPSIDKKHRDMALAFLQESGGFREEFLNDPEEAKEDKEFNNQWSYLTMQMTESLQMLEQEFAGIFGVERGEIDFSDLVLNRRLGFGILPTLEKDKEVNGILARLILANLRKVFASGIGSRVQGNRAEVIDNRVTNYQFSFLVILDEYVQYGGKVKGFGAAAAMARDMGICLVFAGQQESSLGVEAKDELVEIIGNTQTKIGMLIEEEETANRFITRAGETFVAREQSMKRSKSSPGRKYVSEGVIRFEKEKRIEFRDLASQDPGYAHCIIKDKLTRLKVMAALADNDGGEIKLVDDLMLNHLLCIAPPKENEILKVREPLTRFSQLVNDSITVPTPEIPSDPKLNCLIGWYEKLKAKHSSLQEVGFASIAALVDLDPSNTMFDYDQSVTEELSNSDTRTESSNNDLEDDDLETMLNRANPLLDDDENTDSDFMLNVNATDKSILEKSENRKQELQTAINSQLLANLSLEWRKEIESNKDIVNTIVNEKSICYDDSSINSMLEKINFYGKGIESSPLSEEDLSDYYEEIKNLVSSGKLTDYA